MGAGSESWANSMDLRRACYSEEKYSVLWPDIASHLPGAYTTRACIDWPLSAASLACALNVPPSHRR